MTLVGSQRVTTWGTAKMLVPLSPESCTRSQMMGSRGRLAPLEKPRLRANMVLLSNESQKLSENVAMRFQLIAVEALMPDEVEDDCGDCVNACVHNLRSRGVENALVGLRQWHVCSP